MGESEKDRLSMIASLKELQPDSIAINFFHPNEALPIKSNTLDIDEALDLIKYVRDELKNSRIMVAGGRERMFGDRVSEIFDAGCNSIVVGNYLTTSGEKPNKDIQMIESLGLEIASNCDG
jgi:biotin synthase